MKTGLFTGLVMHQRLRPRRHRFAYRCLWLLVDLDDLPRRGWLLSMNRFNLFAWYSRDHADGGPGPLRDKIAALAGRSGIRADGAILLLTMPRILGHGFNPLSIYFCHGADGRLAGLVWEVSSTFGERHSYVLPVDSPTPAAIRQRCAKLMHVSPFLPMDLEYRFRIAIGDDDLSIAIADHDAEGPVLVAAMRLKHRRLTDGGLLRALAGAVTFPFKTLIAIHWEALRLAVKRLQLFRHPGSGGKAIPVHSASSA